MSLNDTKGERFIIRIGVLGCAKGERFIICIGVLGCAWTVPVPFQVLYVPVVSRRGALQAPPHSHVLQLEIKGSGVGSRGEVYVAVSGKDGEKAEQCFYRYGKTNVQVNLRSLHTNTYICLQPFPPPLTLLPSPYSLPPLTPSPLLTPSPPLTPSPLVCQVSPQELRDKLAKQESCGHGNEISSLLQNIGTLKVTLNQLTSAQN